TTGAARCACSTTLTTSRALSAPRSASATGWKSLRIASTSSPKRLATSNGSTSTRNAPHANRPVDHDRAWTALALAYPDAHSGDHRAESREKHAELRRQQNSLSDSGPRRLAVTWPR